MSYEYHDIAMKNLLDKQTVIFCGKEIKEPCEDAVSRKTALALCERFDGCVPYSVLSNYDMLPSVTPQEPKWIPVSERLPEENKTVIASTKYGVYPEARYSKEDGWEWAYESGADYWEELEEVKAWMPLPKPYEPQEKQCADCNHYGKLSLDCGRCDDDCSMFEPQESEG